MPPRRRRTAGGSPDDLFSFEPSRNVMFSLAASAWPTQQRFPVNHATTQVGKMVSADLSVSDQPLLIAGYSSIGELIEFVANWRRARAARPGVVRLLLGSEPFPSQRGYFGSAQEEFADEVRGYWLEHSISVRLSAKVIRVLEELDSGSLKVRAMLGAARLHAKIYVGDAASTVGSSNYTDHGLRHQLEANARFEKSGESSRYEELSLVAENLWSNGVCWEDEFRDLLKRLLQVVSWQEALARACAELLEGDWAQVVLSDHESSTKLWPSQKAGIAQALWVVENVGSVLVADATGSGKTRMGAHLVAAVRHRLLDTGRLRRDRDLTTLVCPPAVLDTWQREALASGVTIMPVSHGLLSRPDPLGERVEAAHVARAQVLAIDEAHNFLSADSNRTRHVRDSIADHVLLFTATPISRGTQDLLSLVELLGADNFEDETLEVLEELDRGPQTDDALTGAQRARLRREIQRFTVRRTKSALNLLVGQNEDAYRHPLTGRICRYPAHEPRFYDTGESQTDEAVAEEIRDAAGRLRGLIQLGRNVRVPETLRGEVSDQQWLDTRLHAARGLARHNVLAAMRSSRAALIEHIAGTDTALRECQLLGYTKAQATGDMISRAMDLGEQGAPETDLSCRLPDWLADDAAWRHACAGEAQTYRQILESSARLSDSRERAKASLLADLAREHNLILAFDRHPITLAAIQARLKAPTARVVIATGGARQSRKRVEGLFARDSTERAIALCSDALNEGLNLQGAAAMVQLDMPTTLRVAEQRVGRLDRMDSPHDQIFVWWPRDGKAFATRATELLLARRQASESLLGSNLPMPSDSDRPVSAEEQIRDLSRPEEAWDGIRDALDPVRSLIAGNDALLSPAVYAEHQHTRHRVMARVAPVAADAPWAFFALAGTRHGAPRWLMLEGDRPKPVIGLESVADRLRARLWEDPPNVAFDDNCERWLDKFLTAAAEAEARLLPLVPERQHQSLFQRVQRCRVDATCRSHKIILRKRTRIDQARSSLTAATRAYCWPTRWPLKAAATSTEIASAYAFTGLLIRRFQDRFC